MAHFADLIGGLKTFLPVAFADPPNGQSGDSRIRLKSFLYQLEAGLRKLISSLRVLKMTKTFSVKDVKFIAYFVGFPFLNQKL